MGSCQWRGLFNECAREGGVEGLYGVEFPPVLKVLEICVMRVPLSDEFKEQLSAREGRGAEHGLCEALIADKGLERHNGGVLAKLVKGAGEAGGRQAAEGGCQDFDPTWSAVEKGVEGHSSTSRSATRRAAVPFLSCLSCCCSLKKSRKYS